MFFKMFTVSDENGLFFSLVSFSVDTCVIMSLENAIKGLSFAVWQLGFYFHYVACLFCTYFLRATSVFTVLTRQKLLLPEVKCSNA